MTENEIELINLIRNNNDPARAMLTAMEIILVSLGRLEPSELKPSVGSVEQV